MLQMLIYVVVEMLGLGLRSCVDRTFPSLYLNENNSNLLIALMSTSG